MKKRKVILFDCDGVLWNHGFSFYPWTGNVLSNLIKRNYRLYFVINNDLYLRHQIKDRISFILKNW